MATTDVKCTIMMRFWHTLRGDAQYDGTQIAKEMREPTSEIQRFYFV